MTSVKNAGTDITVIGLGQMGHAIARLLLRQGYKVSVWNRTASRAADLKKEGAAVASGPAEAIRNSPVTIICVYDYKAADLILRNRETEAALSGRILIQLTTGSPAEARASATWAQAIGAGYLDGAIQVAPEQMGRPDTPILLSGNTEVFGHSEAILKVLGGNLLYLGAEATAASAMDLATLSALYGALLGFFHGARISISEGFDVNRYAEIVAETLPTFGAFLTHEGAVIQSGDYKISQSPLAISIEATERLLETAKQAGISTAFPAFASGVFKKAEEAGLKGEELAALIKVL
jgi:3-hydroxyisobutyrate dehydrogenase-like beta-hydroxyacid dehydrogenase